MGEKNEEKDNLERIAEALELNNTLQTQKLDVEKMNVESNVAFVRMLNNYVSTWDSMAVQDAVLEKLDNLENKLDNFVIVGSNVDIIRNLVPVEWKVDTGYDIGMVVSYKDNIYKVIQKHTSQADWTPDKYPAGFVVLATNEEVKNVENGGYPEFKQPTGSHDAYKTDDIVSFNGKNYISLINNNIWSPQDYPAGWKLIE